MRASIATIFILCLLNVAAIAQAPQGINYQGVARSLDGQPLSQKEISIRIAILNQSADGNIEYNEIHELKTNQFGLFTLVIGKGIPGTGTFNSIDWTSGNKWVQVELDENGGRNFQLTGSQQLMSVPYALYAERAGSGYKAGQGIGINDNMISNLGDGDNSATNELITSVALGSDNKLRITDAGGTKETDLSALVGAAQNLESVLIQGNNAGNNSITNLGTPINTSDAATKAYVDAHVDGDASSTNEIQNLTQVLAQSNNAGGTKITNLGTPTVASDATTKLYVDNLDAADGDKSATNEIQNLSQVLSQNNSAGGTKITNLGTPTVNSDATTKLYVDNLDATDGDKNATNEIQNLSQVLSQNNSAGGTNITNLGTPTVASDATTKSYVDNADDALSARISNTYAFKVTYNHTHASLGATEVVTFTAEDLDEFSLVSGNTFTVPENGTYQFTVSGTSPFGGIAMQIRVTPATGPQQFIDIKRQLGYPLSSIINYFDSTILKLNSNDVVELIVVGGAISEVVTGSFFGFKL